MEVLLFGGTTEGRRLVEWLDARGTCEVVACAATEYGASLVEGGRHVTVTRGPLSASQKCELMDGHDFCCVVDATHPFAQHISQSIDELGRHYGIDVVRIVREDSADGPWTSVTCAADAARLAADAVGNVLLTTGSKDLDTFVEAMRDYQDRLYVRIIPVRASLERVLGLGVPVSHVIAMQGPFSAQLNAALIRELEIACMVTKRSGPTGGFDQKVQAARDCGIELVVIERPHTGGGVLLRDAKTLLEERYGL